MEWLMSVICRLAGTTAGLGRAAWVEAPGGVGGVDAVDIVWNARLEVDRVAPGRAARRLTGISLGGSPDFSANRDQARRGLPEFQVPSSKFQVEKPCRAGLQPGTWNLR